MKKLIVALLLVLAMAVPVFAQDTDVPENGVSILKTEALGYTPIEYKKIYAFDGFTTKGLGSKTVKSYFRVY